MTTQKKLIEDTLVELYDRTYINANRDVVLVFTDHTKTVLEEKLTKEQFNEKLRGLKNGGIKRSPETGHSI